ncbi:tautomerase family protein [Gemmobacter aquatilis]|uniref:tautomerase family protein n=1 Tax=Gemmobacter aquatilis TaxID=933059 RepID=UPI002481ACFB|nr:tautomerase family protein [Gemmobacter aquatilis]
MAGACVVGSICGDYAYALAVCDLIQHVGQYGRVIAFAQQSLAQEITESIVRNTQTDASYISVIFEDVKPSDWAGSGKLFD